MIADKHFRACLDTRLAAKKFDVVPNTVVPAGPEASEGGAYHEVGIDSEVGEVPEVNTTDAYVGDGVGNDDVKEGTNAEAKQVVGDVGEVVDWVSEKPFSSSFLRLADKHGLLGGRLSQKGDTAGGFGHDPAIEGVGDICATILRRGGIG
jgi:hypothetical protein